MPRIERTHVPGGIGIKIDDIALEDRRQISIVIGEAPADIPATIGGA